MFIKIKEILFGAQKYFEAVGEVDLEPELHYEVIDKNWNKLMIAHQDRDQAILEEKKRYMVFK